MWGEGEEGGGGEREGGGDGGALPRLDDEDASQVVQHPRVSTFPLKLIALIICRVSRPSYLFTECVVGQCV